jgi:SepF-like predicted cell division protein (DUF552 family)
MGFFSDLKDKIQPHEEEEELEHSEGGDEEYVELDTDVEEQSKNKMLVRPFVIQDFSDIKDILDGLREGHTIALINIKPLKDKDLVELKRAINKLKKTCDALGGDIAGFGDDWIVATPSSARVHRAAKSTEESAAPEVSEVQEFE